MKPLVNQSDMSRIPGLKNIRARIYYDGGFSSIEKLSKSQPEEYRSVLKKYVEENNISCLPPLPKESESASKISKNLYCFIWDSEG